MVKVALEDAVGRLGLSDVEVTLTGCHGFCQQGPIVVVKPEGIFYPMVTSDSAVRIAEEHLAGGQVVDDLLYVDPTSGGKVSLYDEINFYKKQTRIVLKNCGHIDPESIDDYVESGGYVALKKAISGMSPDDVISEVKAACLRGRGGAGFETGLKWELARKAPGEIKYIICNADEGDPGAFMDRSVLEGDPHAVLEGMAIAAYGVGSAQGYVYVRAEYPLAIKRLKVAIEGAKERSLLGENILGTDFSFDIKIKEGAGAFVCGESTALSFSIEGKRGMPRITPPRSVEKGLFGQPTVLNNVETLANVPAIIEKGAAWFRSIGTEGSPGTKIFALTGKVKNTGLIEVPMGTSLSTIINDIGGGAPNGGELKAVQIGGPSGGCIPKEHLDRPVDFDSLTDIGAMIGSGGLVALDETSCMVDLARYFLAFTQEESCGKCIPCRIGTKRMLEILTRMVKGKSCEEELTLLEELAQDIKVSALCGLGQTAPNPVITMLRYFKEEFVQHVKERKCAAGSCSDLISYVIDEKICTGCGVCVKRCPAHAVRGERKKPHTIDQDKCVKCGICKQHCVFEAIYISK
ncbi:MAG: NADH-ubiquinone oxidoreductase-F iron-sulfur binding region domain-containing protein [Actinomycetota bacterium]|nr:NADH-ubiquinone oxidoreductase-F iron-sulfur binding region domain-containing protein [Actinomycetota bacterium]